MGPISVYLQTGMRLMHFLPISCFAFAFGIQAEMQFQLAIPATLSDELRTKPAGHDNSKEALQVLAGTSTLLQSEFFSLRSSGNVSSGDQCPEKMLMMAYYPDWLGSTFLPSQIAYERFDWIDFAFAVPNAKFDLTWDDPSAPKLLKELVEAAHGAGRTKVKLSIGGWTGSRYLSSAVASNKSRMTFVKNIYTIYQRYDLDGIDIDWEYPGRAGSSGNHFHPSDSAKFLLFLKLLRNTLPPDARISAAVDTSPFADTEGNPMTDVSEFSEVLDWVLIMNYDAWGSSSDPGPNAPLHNACNNSTQPRVSAVASYNAWTAAQFPACKLVLGLPSYGYISSSTATQLQTRSQLRKKSPEFIQLVSPDGDSDHQVQFRQLIEQGALIRSDNTSYGTNNPAPKFVGSGGFERMWDSCSDTPYLRSALSQQIVTYDDPESLGMKAAFAKGVGMLGLNLFDVHGDSDQWDLVDSVIGVII